MRVASIFSTVSENAVCVIASMPPIDIMAAERQKLYNRRATDPAVKRLFREEERKTSLEQWQARWDTSPKGRWTHRLIPNIERWVHRGHGEVGYYFTQLLSGHGCFRGIDLRGWRHQIAYMVARSRRTQRTCSSSVLALRIIGRSSNGTGRDSNAGEFSGSHTGLGRVI